MSINIAVDGPAGAGKSSIAKRVSADMQIIYVDTGALYRTIALYVLRKGADPKNKETVIPLLSEITVEPRFMGGEQRVFLNGEDVSGLIRTEEVSMATSTVSAIPEVRAFLLGLQRKIAAENDVIMDGRDIGTVIMPSADVKIDLTAGDGERAVRRRDELAEKGVPAKLDEIREALTKRDANDMNRTAAPAVAAPDAVKLDNSGFTKEQTLAAAIAIIDKAVMK